MNKKLLTTLSLISIASCSTPSNEKGYIKVDFDFPQNTGFSTKAIPNTTTSFQISVQGDGLTSPIVKTITKDSTEKVLIQELPVGPKKIKVVALDNSQKTLAEAETDIDIKAGQINQATLELKELIKNFKITLANYPVNTPYVFAEIKMNGQVTQQELKTNEINLTDTKGSKVDVKVTAFSEDSTPISNVIKTVDTSASESEQVSLEPVVLPSVSEVSENSSLLIFQLQSTLNRIKVDFKNNTAPKVGKIDLTVNGENRIISTISSLPICLSPSDNIRISVNATDTENDKINLYWLKNTLVNDNKYKVELDSDRSLVYAKSGSQIGVGNHSINFLATDRKSFTGVTSLYFNVSETGCN